MVEIDDYDVKTHFSALLERVTLGEEVIITKNGKAVARLIPANQNDNLQIKQTIQQLHALRNEIKTHGSDWKKLRDEGRR